MFCKSACTNSNSTKLNRLHDDPQRPADTSAARQKRHPRQRGQKTSVEQMEGPLDDREGECPKERGHEKDERTRKIGATYINPMPRIWHKTSKKTPNPAVSARKG